MTAHALRSFLTSVSGRMPPVACAPMPRVRRAVSPSGDGGYGHTGRLPCSSAVAG